MPGPRDATLRAPTTMERIKSGLQDTLGIPERFWGIPDNDASIAHKRQRVEDAAAKGPVMRAPTTMERIRETLAPVTKVAEFLGDPLSNADMGPAKAIGLIARAKGGLPGRLTGEAELLERLIPRNAAGEALDYRQFPNTINAVADAIKRYPRVASHLDSIHAGIDDASTLGLFDVPHRITKQIQAQGPTAYRNWNQPVGRISLNPEAIEAADAISTVFHEFGHAGQYIADPRRFGDLNDKAFMLSAKDYLAQNAYANNPSEIAARAIGRRAEGRAAGAPLSYRDAIQVEIPFDQRFAKPTPGVATSYGQLRTMDTVRDQWQRAKEALKTYGPGLQTEGPVRP